MTECSDHATFLKAVPLLTDNRWKVERIWASLWFSSTEHHGLPPSKLLSFEWPPLSLKTPNILYPTTRYCLLPREWPKKSVKLVSSALVHIPFTLLIRLLTFPFPLNLQTLSLRPQMGFGLASPPPLFGSSIPISWSHLLSAAGTRQLGRSCLFSSPLPLLTPASPVLPVLSPACCSDGSWHSLPSS